MEINYFQRHSYFHVDLFVSPRFIDKHEVSSKVLEPIVLSMCKVWDGQRRICEDVSKASGAQPAYLVTGRIQCEDRKAYPAPYSI